MKINNIIENVKVVYVHPTTTIREALQTMVKSNIRRIAVVDAGTHRVEGVLSSVDIVDFMGGGPKYNLVREKHNRNLYAAINEPVKTIMAQDPVVIKEGAKLKEVLKIFNEKHIGGAPVVDKDNKLISMITERTILINTKDKLDENKLVKDYMAKNPVVATAGERIKDVARTMIRNEFRRLPVIKEGKLIGKITSKDFIDFLGSDKVFEKLKTGNIRELTNMRAEELVGERSNPTVNPNTNLVQCVEIMEKYNTWALPVVENDNLVGIISEKDIVNTLNEQ